ncbi:MAG: hypothetical protein RBS34_00445 [Desulfofustis sp.]|jgi:hypothetical protein|nr:hypothetical protein [Desulfofustis sp.]
MSYHKKRTQLPGVTSTLLLSGVPDWPKKPTYWTVGRTLMVSIPFTWELPGVLGKLHQRSMWWDDAIVGGPAVELMPGFFFGLDYVREGHYCPGVLQRVNPMATRTTVGCVRRCGFCAIGTGRIEGEYLELSNWPDLPVICDNNLLAASKAHFDRVIDRLVVHGWADFNQGVDSRLLTDYHAARLAEIKKPTIRLALDHMDYRDKWQHAFDRLRAAGIAKAHISSYCLIGYQSDPRESWQRCQWVESHGVKAYPMWFHALDQLKKNVVTDEQARLGWTDEDRRHIMGFYYKHRGTAPKFAVAT